MEKSIYIHRAIGTGGAKRPFPLNIISLSYVSGGSKQYNTLLAGVYSHRFLAQFDTLTLCLVGL